MLYSAVVDTLFSLIDDVSDIEIKALPVLGLIDLPAFEVRLTTPPDLLGFMMFAV